MGTSKQLVDLDVQVQHSLCFYPKTDHIGIEPWRKNRMKILYCIEKPITTQLEHELDTVLTSPA